MPRICARAIRRSRRHAHATMHAPTVACEFVHVTAAAELFDPATKPAGSAPPDGALRTPLQRLRGAARAASERVERVTAATWLLTVAVGAGYAGQCIAAPEGALMGFTACQLARMQARFVPLILQGEVWRLLTALFLHGNLMHFLVNFLLVVPVAYNHETTVRSLPHTVWLFLSCGLTGMLLSCVCNPLDVGCGASGPLFGLIAADYVIAIRRTSLREMLPGVVAILFGLVGDVVFEHFMQFHSDYYAHMGGFATGVMAGLLHGHTRSAIAACTVVHALLLVVLFGYTGLHQLLGGHPRGIAIPMPGCNWTIVLLPY